MAKKNKPEPAPCRCCGRLPVTVKVKPGLWRVACPYLDYEYVNAYGSTEAEAIEAWNKEVNKK